MNWLHNCFGALANPLGNHGGALSVKLACRAHEIVFLLAVVLCVPGAQASAQSTDFGGYRPHYQGYGAGTVGGRTGGSRVCVVNTLNISGTPTWGSTGDLLDCLATPPGCPGISGTAAQCARFVLFSVSGTIGTTSATRNVSINDPYITIAGQTAPSCSEGTQISGDCSTGPGGITIANILFLINAHNVVVQHLRFRYLNQSECFVCIGISGGDHSWIHHVVLDHVSVSWSISRYPQVFGAPLNGGDILIVDSIVGEAMYEDGSTAGNNNMGLDLGSNATYTIARNAFINSWGRHPSVAIPGRYIIYNNVVYNGTDSTPLTGGAIYGQFSFNDRSDSPGEIGGGWGVYTKNVVVPGPNSGSVKAFLSVAVDQANFSSGVSIYLQGNAGPGVTGCSGNGQWNGMNSGSAFPEHGHVNVVTAGPSSNIRVNTPPTAFTAFNIQHIAESGDCSSNAGIRDAVLANAGARPRDRDRVDTRLVGDVTDRGGSYVNWSILQSAYGGMPTLAQRSRALAVPTNPNGVVDAAGRTRIEQWLETMARGLEQGSASGFWAPGAPTAVRLDAF
jgi:hypothetical protein